MCKIIIGVDDTDNADSRGTGFIVRQLNQILTEKKIIAPSHVIRHQLYVHKDIPFTSHNSSASVTATLTGSMDELIAVSEKYLIENSADGSDVGFCVFSGKGSQPDKLIQWGLNAKKIVLTEKDAYALAENQQVHLKGLTGRKTGVIGSLAAIGLALYGTDGRILWMKNMRETSGIFSVEEIKELIGLQEFKTLENEKVSEKSKVLVEEGFKPVVQQFRTILYLEKVNNQEYGYKTASKLFIKSISE